MTERMRTAFREVLSAATPTSMKEIKDLSKQKCTFYVIKYKDTIYLSRDISQIRPYLISAYHLCVNCKYCKALPSNMGGCNKVLDIKKRIGDYPFLTLAVESHSTENDKSFFTVMGCKAYELDKPRKNTGLYIQKQTIVSKPVINIHWPY